MAPRVTVEHVGDYSLVIANRASLIPEALEEVEPDRRPPLNQKVLEFFEEHYASDGFKIILACWNGSQMSASLGLWYYPELDIEGYLRLPAFDYHDESDELAFDVPVRVDHQLMFGTPELKDGLRINWNGVKPELLPFLPENLAGIQRWGLEPNGDFGIKLEPQTRWGNLLTAESVVRLSPYRIIHGAVTA